MPKTDLLQGTLDLLILRILALGPNHGWGIANRIRQMSREGLNASHGSLYPALHRLEMSGDVRSEMKASENIGKRACTRSRRLSPRFDCLARPMMRAALARLPGLTLRWALSTF